MSPSQIALAATVLLSLACDDVEPTLDGVTVGVEVPAGDVESLGVASEIAVYIGPAGGYVSYFWLGGDIAPTCLDPERSRECEVLTRVETVDGVVLADSRLQLFVRDPPPEPWMIRIPIFLDLFAMEDGPSAAWGAEVGIQFEMTLHEQSTDPFTASVVLVATDFNPEAQ